MNGLTEALSGKLGKTEQAQSAKSADKVANALTAGEKTYDGSAEVEITASDIGAALEEHTHEVADVTGLTEAIKAEVAKAPQLKRTIVETLPETTEADQNTIYMVKLEHGSEKNTYVEYFIINDQWEKIGTSDADLTGYLKEEDITTITNEEITALSA